MPPPARPARLLTIILFIYVNPIPLVWVSRMRFYVSTIGKSKPNTAAVACSGRIPLDQVGQYLDIAGTLVTVTGLKGTVPLIKIPPPETVWPWKKLSLKIMVLSAINRIVVQANMSYTTTVSLGEVTAHPVLGDLVVI